MPTNTITSNAGLFEKIQIKETVFLLSGSVLLQLIIHIIPSASTLPLGVILLPMFYAPLIAAVFYKPHVSIITATLTPLINFILTGYPKPEMGIVLTVELLIFAVALGIMLKYNSIKKFGALLSYICAVGVAVGIFSVISVSASEPVSSVFSLNSFFSSVPGISILSVINIFLLRLKNKR